MHWTKKAPTKTGWYWILNQGGEPFISELTNDRMIENFQLHGEMFSSTPIPKPTKKPKVSNEVCKSIIEHLNDKTGKSFKSTSAATKRLIQARFNEGFTENDFHRVIENQCRKWLTDPNMMEYLRPATLFSPKFESYLQNGTTTPKAAPRPTNPNFNLNRAYNILANLGMDKFKSYAQQTKMTKTDIEAVEFKYQRERQGMTPERLVKGIGGI